MAKLLSEIYEIEQEEALSLAPPENQIDTFPDFSYGKVASILANTMGLITMMQSAHWAEKGGRFYANHLLFQRIYEELSEFTDLLGERAVGLSKSGEIVNPKRLLCASKAFIESCGCHGNSDLAADMYRAVINYKRCIAKCYNELKADGMLTQGLDNLLQDLLDKVERHEYLLGRIQAGLIG